MRHDDVVRNFGQLFILAFDGRRLTDEVVEFFRTFRIGGVILFADNYRDPAQLAGLTAELRERCSAPGAPLWVATDHEGGRVQRFRKGFTRIPPMAHLGTSDPETVERLFQQVGTELREAGITLNFAPVADVCAPDAPGAIGHRAFGSDPADVAERVAAVVRGLQASGVTACAKHFPGHGATPEDSHHVLPVVEHTVEALAMRDVVPFAAAIEAGVGAVMSAHVLYPDGDARWPASLSRFWMREMLRHRLGFEGLIVTDAIEMKALTSRWTPEACGLAALQAGADVLLYYREAHQYRAFYALRRALQTGRLDARRIAASLERVRRAKKRLLKKDTPEAAETAPSRPPR